MRYTDISFKLKNNFDYFVVCILIIYIVLDIPTPNIFIPFINSSLFIIISTIITISLFLYISPIICIILIIALLTLYSRTIENNKQNNIKNVEVNSLNKIIKNSNNNNIINTNKKIIEVETIDKMKSADNNFPNNINNNNNNNLFKNIFETSFNNINNNKNNKVNNKSNKVNNKSNIEIEVIKKMNTPNNNSFKMNEYSFQSLLDNTHDAANLNELEIDTNN
tara:strand:+ start:1493 stop:2158 length:666 start_codon:yes stop_codon:yes gene_type:complete